MNDRHGNPLSEAAEAQIRWHLMEVTRIFGGGELPPAEEPVRSGEPDGAPRLLPDLYPTIAQVLDALSEGGGQEEAGWFCGDLSDKLGFPPGRVHQMLEQLLKGEKVRSIKTKYGRRVWCQPE